MMETRNRTSHAEVEDFLRDVLALVSNVTESSANQSLMPMVKRCFSVHGKLTRPRAVFHLAQIFGAPLEHAVAWASACEILHSASLVHDDLQDGDTVRRGVPTMWTVFGSNMAINLGDYLLLIAPQAIMNSSMTSDQKVKLYKEFVNMSAKMVGGQCDEFSLNQLRSRDRLYQNYIECIGGKTAVFFSKLARGVGILSGLNASDLALVEDLFYKIGLVFQIQDDILDLFGDKKRDQIGCDIREGKVSILIVYQLLLYPKRFQTIQQLLSLDRSSVSDDQVLELKDRFKVDGTLVKAWEDLQDRIGDILDHPKLKNDLGLKILVSGLIKDIMKPVEHVLPPNASSDEVLSSSY